MDTRQKPLTIHLHQVIPPAALRCIQDVASVERMCAWSGAAVCPRAPTSHPYFWDPAGSAAPTMNTSTCVPEVSMYSEVCRRMSCVKHTFTCLRDGLEEFLVI